MRSRGEDGVPLNSYVRVHDQASGDRVTDGNTGSDGTVSFHLSQGVYSVRVFENNAIDVEDVEVAGGETTEAGVDFGRLVLIYAEGAYARVHDQASGDRVTDGNTGRTGRASWYLREGIYRVQTFNPDAEFADVSVIAGQTTVIGETSNHAPEIEASANPRLIKAGESTVITVRAFDKDDDPLTYAYNPSVGTIEGEGPRVTYTAPDAGGEYRIDVEVTDGRGGAAQTTLFVSGGVLKVTSSGSDETPLNSYVRVHDQASGDRVTDGNTGSDGVVTFRLVQGTYRIVVFENNTISVDDLEVSADRETAAKVFFGRLDVRSRGEDGVPLNSYVRVHDQASGDRVTDGNTGSDGTVSFHLSQGVYSVRVFENNAIDVEDVEVAGGETTEAGVDFGRLVLIYAEGAYARVHDQASGDRVTDGNTGRTGRASWYLREGIYRVQTFNPDAEFADVSVIAGQTTVIGETSNHAPEIEASANPRLIKAGESTVITVRAFDKDDDPLTYAYNPSVGTIEGEGPRVTYTAPDAGGEYRIDVEVTDGRGGAAQTTLFVSGGVLKVTSSGSDETPLNSYVRVHDQASGDRVTDGNTGSDGVVTFRLVQGTYRIVVFENNTISVDDLEVSADRETAAKVFFGRLDVRSRGEDGVPLNSYVRVHDQASGDRVTDGNTGSDGTVSFHLSQGVYSVRVFENNAIDVEDVEVAGGETTEAGVDFGRLVLIYAEGAYARVHDQASGDRVTDGNTGRTGRASWYLREGIYRVQTFNPDAEFADVSVIAGQTTVIGETSNHAPEIEASANPRLIKAGESTVITVRAFDKDDDPLTYAYNPSVGTIEGEGPRVTYTAPDAGGEYRIDVEVTDGRGGAAQTTLFVSGGVLKVTSSGSDETPLNSYVRVHDQASGDRVTDGNTGSDGVVTFRLVQGTYRIVVFENNTISVDDLEVSADRETAAKVFFGRLDVRSRGEDGVPLNSYVRVHDQASGDRVTDGNTGSDGTVSFHLSQGVYSVRVFENNAIDIENIPLATLRTVVVEVLEGVATVTSQGANGPPSILNVVVLQSDQDTFKIAVNAVDPEGDALQVHFATTDSATINATGTSAVIDLDDDVSVAIGITVTDGSGGVATASVILELPAN